MKNKVTWYKGDRCANFDGTDKITAALLTKKGYGPKKDQKPKVEAVRKPDPRSSK